MWLLLVFVCIGLGAVAAVFQPPRQHAHRSPPAASRPLQNAHNNSSTARRTQQHHWSTPAGVRSPQNVHRSTPTSHVCISLPAYEDAEWIDTLLANTRTFTDNSTKVALHLDSKSDYDEARMQGWASDNVVVTSERVSTQVFHGGILYAHVLNAKALAKQFPHHCAYFVLGASNMFWVRRGMEDYVREHEIAPINRVDCNFNPYICDHPVTLDMAGGDHKSVAFSQPEGLFMPMSMVLNFAHYLDQYSSKNHWNVTDKIVREYGQFEEFWLQTWVYNNAKTFLASHGPKDSTSLTYRKLNSGVTMEQVNDVMTGTLPNFAVKRVNRDRGDPVANYVISLSR